MWIVQTIKASISAFGRKLTLYMLMNNTHAYMFMVLKEPLDNIGNRKSVLWRDAMNLANSHLIIYLENTNEFAVPPPFLNQSFYSHCYKPIQTNPNEQTAAIVNKVDAMQ